MRRPPSPDTTPTRAKEQGLGGWLRRQGARGRKRKQAPCGRTWHRRAFARGGVELHGQHAATAELAGRRRAATGPRRRTWRQRRAAKDLEAATGPGTRRWTSEARLDAGSRLDVHAGASSAAGQQEDDARFFCLLHEPYPLRSFYSLFHAIFSICDLLYRVTATLLSGTRLS